MFTQPTVNQIASTYKGNPAPLNAKVQADKKQNGGIPQDLRQLMAAYDLSQGRQNMGIQQALQIPTNMPTVAQDVQELARQALQARQMQAAQEQMRKDGKPNMVPMGTPRPPMQAQGLDMLESNVGEEYAHGGIIGDVAHFDGKTGSKVEDSNKEYSDESLGMGYLPERPKPLSALAKLISNAIARPKKPSMMLDESEAPNITPAKEAETPTETSPASVKVLAPPAPPSANPITQNRVNVDKAPMPGGLKDLAGIPSDTEALSMLKRNMRLNPEAEGNAVRDRFMKEVGARDLSIYDKTAAELEARKQKLNAPKAGYDAMMEYLEQVALGGGRTSAESGSIGASRQRALQKERLSQQDLLMDKILDLGAKKSEAQYAEKKSMFDMTQKERDEVYKRAFDAAKSVDASDNEAKRIAAQAVENEKNRLNQIRVAQIGAQDRDNLMSRAKALMAADPTKKMTLEQAMQRAAEIGAAGQMDSADARRLATFSAKEEKINSRPEFIPMLLDKKNDPKFAAAREKYAAEIRQARLDSGLPAAGINALPSAGGPTSSNVRSQADAIIAGGR
jgi:hypothetical protein